MEFFRLLERLLPNYLKENITAGTEENNNIIREPTTYQCYSDFVSNSNILETERNSKVNSNEYVSIGIGSSIDSTEEFGVTKTLHNLENVTPIEITTYDDTDPEPMENEKSLIKNANIFNNDSGASLITSDIEDRYRGIHSGLDDNANILESERTKTSIDNIEEFGVTKSLHNLENVTPIEINTNVNTYQELMENEISLIEDIILNNAPGASLVINDIEDETVVNKSNNDLKYLVQIRHDTEVSNDVRNTEADTTYNNLLNYEAMQKLEDLEAALHIKDKHAFSDAFGTELINLDEFKDIFNETDAVNVDLVGNNLKNLNDNIDIITIDSSTEDEISQKLEMKDTVSMNDSDETDSDDGYNSSDFEFISETEANMAGIIINHGIEKHHNLSQTSSEPIIFYFDHQGNEESDPGEGPSSQNGPRNEFEDRSYRNNHHIPVGDDYLGLFQGIYNPLIPVSDILFLENKSVRASAMNMQYDGIGFDKQLAMRRHQPDSSEDEFEDEAKESAKKILKMYPGENRKRRRRY